ncbi:hypothetical protein D8780_14110 [Notoacmeibacter ruber]|uniref:Uncharacterized protein n=1 Tax=Notoacmeibacter ruber TaxID=2670375 RepID=A0A3L7JEJ8_9HYPH|nr:hypothetical protein D8780_14110 [Notoacmeibacter ruber]
MICVAIIGASCLGSAAHAQFTVENPTGLAPSGKIFGPRYAVPDRIERDRRYDPYSRPEEGVSRFADEDFVEENVPPYRDRRRAEEERRWRIERPDDEPFPR